MPDDLVLLTGISGFIAKHVALELLAAGYRVRGTVRSPGKIEPVRETLAGQGADVGRLEFAVADLTDDDGWRGAAAGCRFVVHTASPFPATSSRDKRRLVPVARGGTLRVVEAAKAADAERIVLTSSVAAITYGHPLRGERPFTEADWSDVESPAISDYAVSKTEAERAAWEAVRAGDPELVAVNPAFVLGPLLDDDAGTSAAIVRTMMKGRMPAVPDIAFGIVDVRDVARAHLEAMRRPESAGRRFILSAGALGLMEIGEAIASAEPAYARRTPRFVLPDFVVRAVALLAPQARAAVPELGQRKRLDASVAADVLGLRFRDPQEAVAAMAGSLRRLGLV